MGKPDDEIPSGMIYLATPYSKYKGGDLLQAYRDAASLAGRLLLAGYVVYSPIAHTHPIAMYTGIDPLDHSIWLPFDEVMMNASSALVVAHMEGWDTSVGIAYEIKHFMDAGKPVYDLDVITLKITKR